MTFDVSADAYTRFMGRFSEPLAARFLALVDPRPGQRALDVGCGPGALTAELVQRLGASAVSAIDPSESFVAAASARFPEIDVHCTGAEQLPFQDDTFDLVLAQLVVQFMADPAGGIAEMARVARPGGLVAACVWDHGGGKSPLAVLWQAVHDLDPDAPTESDGVGAREGQLAALFEDAGLGEVRSTTLTVRIGFPTFDEWWEPFTFGVGPAGAHVAKLDARGQAEVRDRCAQLLPTAPFEIEAMAWTALGRA